MQDKLLNIQDTFYIVMESYASLYRTLQEDYGIRLDFFSRRKIKEIVDSLGGLEVIDDMDVFSLLFENVLCGFRDESPAIREIWRERRRSEEFMVALYEKSLPRSRLNMVRRVMF